MIAEKKDWELLKKSTECVRQFCSIEDLELWMSLPRNLMFSVGNNVGLATYDYPGMYTVHWYYEVRGKEAIDLAKQMLANLFENYGAEVVRGFVKDHLKASRWATRQVGLKSLGFITFPDGDVNELFVATKDNFMKDMK